MLGEVLPQARARSATVLRCVLFATTVLALPVAASLARAQTQAPSPVPQAGPAQHNFDIAALPLSDALALFGRQANVQILAHGDLVSGLRSSPVKGSMPTEVALRQLLAGTGLLYRIGADGAITLQAGGATTSSVTMLSHITVEGRMTDDRFGAADRASSLTVTQTDLERRAPTNIREVFAGEAGVSVGGGIPLSQKVYVHGVEETNLAVSIDGARQNNKIFHHSGTNLMDPSLLKAARIDPGVAPADAGPAALGGAIVYETVDVADVLAPGRNFGGFATLSYESNGGTVTNGNSAYGKIGGAEVLGFFKWTKGDDYDAGNGAQTIGTGADMRSGLFKTALESDRHRLELSAEQVRDRAARPYRGNIGSLTNRPAERERTYDLQRRNFVLNYSMPDATGLWDPKIVLAYSASELRLGVPSGSIGETGGISGKFENDFNFDSRNTLTAGVDFYDDEASYHDATTREIAETASNTGVYAQARIQPHDLLRLSFGGRGDRQEFKGVSGYSQTETGLSGNVSAASDVTDNLTLKAGYSNIWGGVALAENFIFNRNWNYRTGISPVHSENYTTGFDAHVGGFTFNAGLFRNNFENFRDASFNGGPAIMLNFETRGYDLGGGYNWGNGFVRATYTNALLKLNGALTESDASQYLGTPIGRIISLEASHRFEDLGVRVGGTIDKTLKNAKVASNTGPLPGYTVVSLYTEYQPAQAEFLTLRLEVNNLFDEIYADRATYGQEFTNVRPLYEPGRSVMLMAKAKF
ncbi:TonB-dependent receptor [Ferrovibrio sp.]|uniref:TonB-dependent receptor n=1 Tax=Ferrovibrio sp. TaxID=1917215 RepID=UPI0025C52F56|nr:TonB-dependent receptor [Ferrovibrio sp.]MBX3454675.1 TonB-dependent receptor [Ferrovibrio sp.]